MTAFEEGADSRIASNLERSCRSKPSGKWMPSDTKGHHAVNAPRDAAAASGLLSNTWRSRPSTQACQEIAAPPIPAENRALKHGAPAKAAKISTGRNGRDITDQAALRPGRDASSTWTGASWPETSAIRMRRSRSALLGLGSNPWCLPRGHQPFRCPPLCRDRACGRNRGRESKARPIVGWCSNAVQP